MLFVEFCLALAVMLIVEFFVEFPVLFVVLLDLIDSFARI